jgi:hypothetical protein
VGTNGRVHEAEPLASAAPVAPPTRSSLEKPIDRIKIGDVGLGQ